MRSKKPTTSNSFIKVPTADVDALKDGILDSTSFSILILLRRLCDWQTGICKQTCASELLVDNKDERSIRRRLEFLEDTGRISRKLPPKGSHLAYQITINNYEPPVGENKGKLLRSVEVNSIPFSQWLTDKTSTLHGQKKHPSRSLQAPFTDTANSAHGHPCPVIQDKDKILFKNKNKTNQDEKAGDDFVFDYEKEIEHTGQSSTAESVQDNQTSRSPMSVKEFTPAVESHREIRLTRPQMLSPELEIGKLQREIADFEQFFERNPAATAIEKLIAKRKLRLAELESDGHE